jgi:hypothetical protein
MKCELCGNTNSKYNWGKIPLLENKILCDNCAKAQLKAFFEDNGPEYSAESASNYAEYKQALELLENFD